MHGVLVVLPFCTEMQLVDETRRGGIGVCVTTVCCWVFFCAVFSQECVLYVGFLSCYLGSLYCTVDTVYGCIMCPALSRNARAVLRKTPCTVPGSAHVFFIASHDIYSILSVCSIYILYI